MTESKINTSANFWIREERSVKRPNSRSGKIKLERLLKEMPYKDFLKSDHWRKTKENARKLGKYKECYCCGSKDKNLHLHHTTYRYKGTRMERKQCLHLVCVCPPCHYEIHQLAENTPMGVRKATNLIKDSKKKNN